MSQEFSEPGRRHREGMACYRKGDLEGALRIADELRALQHSGHFELEALVHAARGDRERAIGVLESGVLQAPRVWVLWQLLGNLRSDAGRHAAAHAAYEQALLSPRVDRDSVELNRAVATHRAGDARAALDLLARVADPRLRALRGMHAATMLRGLGRNEEAERHALDVLAETEGEDLAVAHDGAALGLLEIRIEAGDAPWVARERAVALAAELVDCPRVLGWIRTLDGVVSRCARRLDVGIHGRFAPDESIDGCRGYVTRIAAIADDAAKALELARGFLERMAPAEIEVEDAVDGGAAPGELEGVVRLQELHLYVDD
jgi:tetratricopeptide (TPR) repeat protein